MAGIPGARYYAVNDRPVAVVPTADGGADCVVFDFATGELVPDRQLLRLCDARLGQRMWTR